MYSILLVDDEKAIREYLPKAIPFEEYGFKVKDTAVNGQDALDKLPLVKPDLILLDVQMPIMDGLQFLSQLKQGDYSQTMVVMLSSYSEFSYAKQAMKYGAQAYLNKPIDEDEIIPLLKEIHNKLDEYNNKMRLRLIREQVNKLRNLYNGEAIDRKIFCDYTLMTCVLLPCSQDLEDKKPHVIMKECLSTILDASEDHLFHTNGSQYSFLLPNKILAPFNNNKRSFGNYLLDMFKKKKINCSIFFDSYIFNNIENSFKEDFSNHMNRMLTELFFSQMEYMEYKPDLRRTCEKLCFGCKQLEEIKQYFLSHNKAELIKSVEKLMGEIEKAHLEIQEIREITYRIYYILLDALEVTYVENGNEAILTRPEWFDYPHFISFMKWKEMILDLVHDGINFVEHRCKMVNMGISREVIEYVHQHYMEQINLKEIADKFFVNATYLGRAFQKATGVNFKQYVNSIRIAEAKNLLLHTDKRIYEIAEAVGYSESKYFVVKFTQEIGISPTEYRKNSGLR
ncbi:response regulator transcription factor [Clostridium thermarum]|uniref:response regulator transcription factor n=1 Tax=Clostridium thermarum TaxID=1716543 RepID=UPI00111E3161|nr:response regulator [Clostridium thermarum]